MYADGASRLEVEVSPPATLRDVIAAVATARPAIGRRVQDETGTVRPHVNLFVGQDNARDLDGLDTAVPDGAEVSVLAAVSGGSTPTGRPGSITAPDGRARYLAGG